LPPSGPSVVSPFTFFGLGKRKKAKKKAKKKATKSQAKQSTPIFQKATLFAT